MGITGRVSIDEMNLPVSTPLPSSIRDITKGSVTDAHVGITASVAVESCKAIDLRAGSGIHAHFEITAGTGSWTIDLYGCPTSGGTYVPQYDADGGLLSRIAITSSRGWIWPAVGANYIKIVPTEVVDGATVNISITPIP